MKKRIISIIVLTAMILASIVFSIASTSFSDLSNHWAKENIEDLASKGIIDGYTDGTFKPEGTVTYGEFVKMLVVAVTGENIGVSTDGTHWASGYYEAALDNGILRKNDIPEKFLPNKIPRADMAYLVTNSLDEVLDEEKIESIKNYIKDIEKAGNRKDEVIYAYGMGILAGYPDKTFKPSGVLTRAESAAVISRVINPDLRLEIDFKEPVDEISEMPELTEDIPLNDYALTIPESAKKPLSEISNFPEVIKKTVKYYAIVDNSSYNFYISIDLVGDECISIKQGLTDYFALKLIKNNEIIYGTQKVDYQGVRTYGITRYDGAELPDFDYIGLIKSGNYDYDTMILIENPFK